MVGGALSMSSCSYMYRAFAIDVGELNIQLPSIYAKNIK